MIITLKIHTTATGRGSRSAMSDAKNSVKELASYLEDYILDFLHDCDSDLDNPDITWLLDIKADCQ